MRVEELLNKIKRGERLGFRETIEVIAANYDYTPTRFVNGIGEDRIINGAGTNEGSCKIFCFAKMNGLSAEETLALFGEHYWRDVLENPDGSDHRNIRAFIKHGWEGITYDREPLTRRR